MVLQIDDLMYFTLRTLDSFVCLLFTRIISFCSTFFFLIFSVMIYFLPSSPPLCQVSLNHVFLSLFSFFSLALQTNDLPYPFNMPRKLPSGSYISEEMPEPEHTDYGKPQPAMETANISSPQAGDGTGRRRVSTSLV